MIIYDWLIEPAILTYSLYYFFPSSSLITHLFTQDSVSGSLRYLLSHLGLPIESKPLNLTKALLFTTLSSIYYLSQILTWGNFPYIYLYYMITLMTTPVILEYLFTYAQEYTKQLMQWQRRNINHLGCLCLAKSINYICLKNLNTDPRLSATELEQVADLNDMTYIWTFLKILLITTLIKYIKKSGSYWGKILQILYDSGSLIEIPANNQSIIFNLSDYQNDQNDSTNQNDLTNQNDQNNQNSPSAGQNIRNYRKKNPKLRDPKKILSEIMLKRKWYYFYDPQVLNMIIKIYQEQEGNCLTEIIQKLKTRIFRFFSLWTLSRIIPLPILAFILRIPDENIPYNMIIPIIDLSLIVFFPQRIIAISFFSEFIEYLYHPSIFKTIELDRIKYLWRLLSRETRYNKFLCISIPTVLYFSTLNNSSQLIPFQGMTPEIIIPFQLIIPTNILTSFFLIMTAKYNFIYLWLILLGSFSNYNFFHLVSLNLILYLIINLINKSSPEPSVKIDVIKSYWSKKDDQNNGFRNIPRLSISD